MISDRQLRGIARRLWWDYRDPMWDIDDLVQAARIGMWRGQRPRHAMIDALRGLVGRGTPNPQHLEYDPEIHDRVDRLVLAPEIPRGRWLGPQCRAIVAGLMEGREARDIADGLGVHESRVSQRKRQLRVFYEKTGWPDE